VAALAAALALVGAACGSRTSAEEVRALLTANQGDGDDSGGRSASDTDSGTFSTDAAPAENSGTDTGTATDSAAPATPAPGAAPTPSASPQSGGSRAPAAAPARAAGQPAAPRTGAAAAPAPGGGGAPAQSGGAAPAPAPAPGGAAPAPASCTGSEAPIIIATVGTTSGILGDVYGSGFKTLKAWVAAKNAAGGINCHPIKHVLADDGADPARHQALVRKVIEEDKAIALVWQAAALSAASSKDYEIQNKIPVISQDGGMFYFYDTPVHFPIGANGDALQRVTVHAGALAAQAQNKTKAAVLVCQEIEYCVVAEKIFPDQAKASGLEIVYQGNATLTQPDYTSQCLQAQNAGAQILLTAFDGATDQRIMASCKKVGFTPILVASSNQQSQDWLTDPNMEGSVVGSSFLPWFINHPAIAEYQAAVKKYAPGSPFEASGIGAWAAAKAFEAVAKAIGPKDVPTKEKIFEGAFALKGETLGGLVYPMTFNPQPPQKKVGCGWVVINKGGQSTGDGKMFCIKGMEP
jgi:branched-chain amino acid transport system substrate-binding protein